MSYAYPERERQIVADIVQSPGFHKLVDTRTLPWQQVLLVLGCHTVFWGGAWLFLQGLYPWPLMLLTSAFAAYAAFTPLHDAAHGAASKSPFFNELIGTLSAQLLVPGATARLYRYLHLEHHRHTGDPVLDPDEVMVSATPIKRFFAMLFIDITWLRWQLKFLDRRSRRDNIIDAITLVVTVAWHVGWLLSPLAWEFVLVWVLPQRLGVLITAYLFASIQHPEGVVEHSHPFQATRMFKGGWLSHILMISQSQHLMHHLFPMVPYYRYNGAWKLSQDYLKDEGIIWDVPVGTRKMPEQLPTEASNGLIDVQIVRTELVAEDVLACEFAACSGADLPAFEAGAHIDVHITQQLVRQYSLTGLASQGNYAIAVKLEADGRGGSKRLHAEFAEGKRVRISKPRNLFALQADDSYSVLVAGGIGLTPILAMANELHGSQRPFELHIAARSEAALPFSSLLNTGAWSDQVKQYLDDVRLSAADLPRYRDGARLYLCGPQGFMDAVKQMAAEQGWPTEAVLFEAFTSDVDNSNNQPFTVSLSRSGLDLEVPADQSLLDVLQANQVKINASCLQGFCGTCRCKVQQGDIEHRDQYLSDDERSAGEMTACVSRAAGEHLVLDL
jgi:vanillate O-demethylase ferredoxin subunit